MQNRVGEFVSKLSGEMAYKSFKPHRLPPMPSITIIDEMIEYLA